MQVLELLVVRLKELPSHLDMALTMQVWFPSRSYPQFAKCPQDVLNMSSTQPMQLRTAIGTAGEQLCPGVEREEHILRLFVLECYVS